MIAMLNKTDRYQNTWDECEEAGRFERFTYRKGGDFPVRSHTARTRAKCAASADRLRDEKLTCLTE